MKEKNAAKRNKNLYTIVGILLVAVFLTVGGLYAKYIYQKTVLGSVNSPKFYFVSDKLTKAGAEHTLNADTESFEFRLFNYADSLRFSDDAINYTVTVTPNDGITVTPMSGSIVGGAVNEALIRIEGLENGKTYTVTAVGNAGFKETLTATVTVKEGDKTLYKNLNLDEDAYILLTVWTGSIEGEVTISYPKGLIPDNTDPMMAGAEVGPSSFILPFGKKNSHTFRFFKDVDYDEALLSSVSVSMDGNEATESAIP